MNARETFEALLAGKKIVGLSSVNGKPDGYYVRLAPGGYLVRGRPGQRHEEPTKGYLIFTNGREIYTETNPYVAGTFAWARFEYHSNHRAVTCGGRIWDYNGTNLNDLSEYEVVSTAWSIHK